MSDGVLEQVQVRVKRAAEAVRRRPQHNAHVTPALASRIDALAMAAALMLLGWLTVQIAFDQAALLPPRSPTPKEVEAARPWANANWAIVETQIEERLPEPSPADYGEVWATRYGQICGFVDHREAAVDGMVRFYTLKLRPYFKSDGEQRYIRAWTRCSLDHYVQLHRGVESTGFCASRGGRSVLGRLICRGESF